MTLIQKLTTEILTAGYVRLRPKDKGPSFIHSSGSLSGSTSGYFDGFYLIQPPS